jgi:hypothetical protein
MPPVHAGLGSHIGRVAVSDKGVVMKSLGDAGYPSEWGAMIQDLKTACAFRRVRARSSQCQSQLLQGARGRLQTSEAGGRECGRDGACLIIDVYDDTSGILYTWHMVVQGSMYQLL